MARVQRLAVQFDITCSAEKFYRVFRENMGLLVELFPENFQRYKFVQGNEFGNGPVIIWNYNFGAPATAKLRHDTDDAAKTITFTVMEGELLETFKSFVEKLQVEHGVAKWSIEFEKLNPNMPNPNEFLDLYKGTRGSSWQSLNHKRTRNALDITNYAPPCIFYVRFVSKTPLKG